MIRLFRILSTLVASLDSRIAAPESDFLAPAWYPEEGDQEARGVWIPGLPPHFNGLSTRKRGGILNLSLWRRISPAPIRVVMLVPDKKMSGIRDGKQYP